MEHKAPVAEKVLSARKFGYVEGEYRGDDPAKLMNPPVQLQDHYFWMRDDTRSDPKIIEHIKRENQWTDSVIEPHKELVQQLYKEIKSHICQSYDTYAFKINNIKEWRYFKRFQEGKKYQNHWRRITDAQGKTVKQELLLDVNKLADGKPHCDVKALKPSPCHKYVTYGVDWSGNQKYQVYLIDLQNNKETKTNIPILVYCSYFWVTPDLLYYVLGDQSNRMYQLYLYNVQSQQNKLVYQQKDQNHNLDATLSDDENYVIVSSGNYDENWCKYIDFKMNPIEVVDFLPKLPKVRCQVQHHNGNWFIHTNKDAVNWQVLKTTQPGWQKVVPFIPPSQIVTIGGFNVFSKFFVFVTNVNGNVYINIINPERTTVKVLTHLRNQTWSWDDYIKQDFANIKSDLVYTIEFGYNCIYETDKINIRFNSMTTPQKLYDYDVQTLNCIQVYALEVPNYKQQLYQSKRLWVKQEGTRLGIPVSILYRKDLFKNDKTNPLFLYGYGSYGITIYPNFNHKILPLVDRGYVYAIAHVRGGSFLGYDWYEDGRMKTKINTFKDFIRCAQYFAESGLIDPKRIVIEGRSAGGLLMGSTLAMRPDLFWICIPIVPFVDLLNTMCDSTIPLTKQQWTQWGNPNQKQWFECMKQYCPYTNIKIAKYPHIYSSTGLHDPRVPYWQILKLIAKIRELKTDGNVQVIRIEVSQGHFGGSSRYKEIEDLAEKYAFVFTRAVH